jgi:hypothetical protein
MGTTLSVLSQHAFRVHMTHETMIGLMLATPFFIRYLKETMDRYSTNTGSTVLMERIQEYEESSNVKLLNHRSLLTGTIPDLVPSSTDSISTAQAFNAATSVKDREPVEPVDLFPALPKVVHIENQDAEPPLGSPETVPQESSILRGLAQSPVSVSFEEEGVECIIEPSTSLSSFEDELVNTKECLVEPSTSAYLESVARALAKKARHADHADKVGIAQALVELGGIILKDDQYQGALKVFKRAEVVQKIIIEDTISAVASAMAQQAKYHAKQGNAHLARSYGHMANELGAKPTPQILKKTIELHHNLKSRDTDKELKSLNKKLDRRLKRASAEAMPLVQNLKTQAKCSSLLRK